MNTHEKPWFTRLIDSYSDLKAAWADRNDLHTRAIEQAASDRNLFQNSKPKYHAELRFPEYVYALYLRRELAWILMEWLCGSWKFRSHIVSSMVMEC